MSRDGIETHTSTHISRMYHPPGDFLRFINGMVFPIKPDPMAFPLSLPREAQLARDEIGSEEEFVQGKEFVPPFSLAGS